VNFATLLLQIAILQDYQTLLWHYWSSKSRALDRSSRTMLSLLEHEAMYLFCK